MTNNLMKRRWYLPLILSLVIIVILLSSYLTLMLWWRAQYDENDFNCVAMSYAVAPIFHRLGFDTRIFYGSNNDSAHAWLCVNGMFFDATSLWFNNENEYTKITFIDQYPYGYTDELLEAKGR